MEIRLTGKTAILTGARSLEVGKKLNSKKKPAAKKGKDNEGQPLPSHSARVERGSDSIHFAFELAKQFRDQQIKAGNALKDNNGKFTSSSGDVAVYRELDIGYDPGDYNDLTVFMPFSELDLEDGNHDLKLDAKLIYKTGGLIQQLTTKDFNYKQGDTVVKKGEVTAKVTRVWADYNVTEEGRKGMRLHVNFEVTGLKGIDSMVSARVSKASGDFLKNDSADYSNDEGLLQIKFAMKPGFDTTVYKDADLFLPYNEIIVSKGKSQLKFDIDLNYENGEMIQHLDFFAFQFDQP